MRNPDFEKCLKKNRIRQFSPGPSLVPKELKTAENDLKEAKESYKKAKYKWATIQSYYSMFHSARALLYNKKYREKSHYCLVIALKVLYRGKVSPYLIEGLQKGKNLREDADYYDEWSNIGAREIIELANKFLKTTRDIVKGKIK